MKIFKKTAACQSNSFNCSYKVYEYLIIKKDIFHVCYYCNTPGVEKDSAYKV